MALPPPHLPKSFNGKNPEPPAGGGARPPPFTTMANQPRFEIADIERLFRALLPDGTPNPFGEILTTLTTAGERFEEEVEATQEYRDAADEDRDSIKSRTFGILLLQIFKTLKIFFSILPQGRLLLLILAVIGLAVTILDDKPITLDAIREAAAKTGIAKFIDDLLAELKVSVGEISTELSDVADIISVAMAQAAGKFERLEQVLAISRSDVEEALQFMVNFQNLAAENLRVSRGRAEAALGNAIRSLSLGLQQATGGANITSNVDVFITPVLRRLPGEISKIPDLAGKLIRFD